MTSLLINSTNPCSKKAVFTSKANLQDVTNPNVSPAAVLGGLTMQTTMTDNGEPGINNDMIGVTLWNGNTLVYSSNWISTQTVELLLNGGNLKLHNGVVCSLLTTRPATNTDKQDIATDSPISIRAYPNPFSSFTTIRYELQAESQISLAVYNNMGEKVSQLAEGRMSAGYHEANFDATKLAAGIYIYRFKAVGIDGKEFKVAEKLVVVK